MMKPHQKTIIFLADGMADEPIAALNGKTPLQAAHTPYMDSIASQGRSGTLLTLPKDFPTSSDVANMSVLGCDLRTEFCGRGVLEAASQGIPLTKADVAFRVNLVTVAKDGTLADYSGGHIDQKQAEQHIQELNDALATDKIRFHPGVSYRNLLILSGEEFSAEVQCDKPDDSPGKPVSEHLPRAKIPQGAHTATVLNDLIAKAAKVLERHAANAIWPWSPGRAGAMKTLRERYGISGAVISAVDVIKGLGRCLGMDVVNVPGATGYTDTNYEGKAKAAIEAIKTHDLVYLHVEAIDEVSHEQDAMRKVAAIEDFDARIVRPVMKACGKGVRYVVLPDHPVPVALGRHTRTPVPVAMCGPDIVPDNVETFDEFAAPCGALGVLFGEELMETLF